jgi:copper(I)-binding protein
MVFSVRCYDALMESKVKYGVMAGLGRKPLFAMSFGLAAAVFGEPANAQVTLSQNTFEAGVNFAAFFVVERGCEGSPTLSLRVEIPDGVTVVELPQKEGWRTNAEKRGTRVNAVSWRGRLEGGEKGQFPVLLKLPSREGPLYFPTVQSCAKGEMRWTQIPAAGTDVKPARPAPAVTLTAAAERPASFMAGNVMVMQPWSRATPPGAQTAAGYMTIMNHGTLPDTLLGGSTPVAGKLEIHTTSTTNGIMSMRPATDGIPLPPGANVVLQPVGAYHMMLSGLKAPLQPGTKIPATLEFSRAGKLTIEISVEPITATGPSASPMDHAH